MSPPAAPDQPAAPDPAANPTKTELPLHSTSARWVVRLTILAGTLLLAGALVLLLYRWLTVTQPRSIVAAIGDESFSGTLVEMDGMNISRPYRVVLGQHNDYRAVFYLQPGLYTLRVSLHGHELLVRDLEVREQTQSRLNLTLAIGTTRPATGTTRPTAMQ